MSTPEDARTVRYVADLILAHAPKRTTKDRYGYFRTHCECGWAGSPWDGPPIDFSERTRGWTGKDASKAEHREHLASVLIDAPDAPTDRDVRKGAPNRDEENET